MYVYTPDMGKGIYFFYAANVFFQKRGKPAHFFWRKLLVSSTVFLYVFRNATQSGHTSKCILNSWVVSGSSSPLINSSSKLVASLQVSTVCNLVLEFDRPAIFHLFKWLDVPGREWDPQIMRTYENSWPDLVLTVLLIYASPVKRSYELFGLK